MKPSPEIKIRLLEAVRRTPSPTRQRASKQLVAIIAAAIAIGTSLFVAAGGLRAGTRPTSFLVFVTAGSTAIALLSAWGAFTRGGSMLGRRRGPLLALTFATPVVLFAWLLLGNVLFPETFVHRGPVEHGCFALTLALAVWPLALIMVASRERNPCHAGLTGAARGSAIGTLASVLVTLWCPVATPAHVAQGHILPILLIAICGAWIGTRFSGVSARTRS